MRKTNIKVLKICQYYLKSAFFLFMKEVAGRVFETAGLDNESKFDTRFRI